MATRERTQRRSVLATPEQEPRAIARQLPPGNTNSPGVAAARAVQQRGVPAGDVRRVERSVVSARAAPEIVEPEAPAPRTGLKIPPIYRNPLQVTVNAPRARRRRAAVKPRCPRGKHRSAKTGNCERVRTRRPVKATTRTRPFTPARNQLALRSDVALHAQRMASLREPASSPLLHPLSVIYPRIPPGIGAQPVRQPTERREQPPRKQAVTVSTHGTQTLKPKKGRSYGTQVMPRTRSRATNPDHKIETKFMADRINQFMQTGTTFPEAPPPQVKTEQEDQFEDAQTSAEWAPTTETEAQTEIDTNVVNELAKGAKRLRDLHEDAWNMNDRLVRDNERLRQEAAMGKKKQLGQQDVEKAMRKVLGEAAETVVETHKELTGGDSFPVATAKLVGRGAGALARGVGTVGTAARGVVERAMARAAPEETPVPVAAEPSASAGPETSEEEPQQPMSQQDWFGKLQVAARGGNLSDGDLDRFSRYMQIINQKPSPQRKKMMNQLYKISPDISYMRVHQRMDAMRDLSDALTNPNASQEEQREAVSEFRGLGFARGGLHN